MMLILRSDDSMMRTASIFRVAQELDEHPKARVHPFSKNLGIISKIQAPDWWHVARYTLKTHKYYEPRYKILSPDSFGHLP